MTRGRVLALLVALALPLGTFTFPPIDVEIPKGFTFIPVPGISGDPTVGTTVRASPGPWEPRPSTFKYQWLRSGKPIKGATKVTYKLTSADLEKRISVEVTAVKSGYSSPTKESRSYKVLLPLKVPERVTITGGTRVGALLGVKMDEWGPGYVRLQYRWLRENNGIGQSGKTYQTTAADAGKRIKVIVTGYRDGYRTEKVVSVGLTPLWRMEPGTPSIPELITFGQRVEIDEGVWESDMFTYQWRRDGVAIPEATKKWYTPRARDLGHYLDVVVTASKPAYASVSAASNATLITGENAR